MKSNELQVGKIYAVIPAWEYSSQDKKDPQRVQANHVAKATLVSLEKYEYKVYRSITQDDSAFEKAQNGSRSVGYLVYSDQHTHNGSPIYWLARAQDIVALYDSLEPRWAEEKRQEEERVKEEEARRAKAKEEEAIREANRQRYETATREALRSVIGITRVTENSVQFNTRYNSGETTVELSQDVLNILIEKVLEAKDLVG